MYDAHRSAAGAYKSQEILNAPRERVVGYMLQGLESFLMQAKVAMEQGNIPAAGEKIGRAQAIVWELLGALNMEEGGEVAQNLSRIYKYMIDQLVEANLKKDPAPVDDVLRVLSEIKAGWNELLTQRKS